MDKNEKMSDFVNVSWYTCDCDWWTKYCDEHHRAWASVPVSKNDRVPAPSDVHGYVEFFRRLTWAVVYIILAAALVGASIFHDTWSAK